MIQDLHLIYHELRNDPSSYAYALECSAFEQHCDLFARLRHGDSTTFHPVVTFDDGHRSNYEFALPILQRHGIVARFFITVGWTNQRPGYANWHELRALHANGHHIGAHGWSHALLTHCTASELDRELTSARHALEDGLGVPVVTMSLPGGRSNDQVLQACWNAGYEQVFTSFPRAESPVWRPRTTIGRLNIRRSTSPAMLDALLKPASGALRSLERQEHLKGAMKAIIGDKAYAKVWALLNRQQPEADPSGQAQ